MNEREQLAVHLERARWVLLRLWSALDRDSARLPNRVQAEVERDVFPPVFQAIEAALSRVNTYQDALWSDSEAALIDALEGANVVRTEAQPVKLGIYIDAALVRVLEMEAGRQRRAVSSILEQAVRHWFGCRELPDRLPVRSAQHPAATWTHCKHGHPFTPDNIYVHHGRRACRICKRIREKARADRDNADRRQRRREQREQIAA